MLRRPSPIETPGKVGAVQISPRLLRQGKRHGLGGPACLTDPVGYEFGVEIAKAVESGDHHPRALSGTAARHAPGGQVSLAQSTGSRRKSHRNRWIAEEFDAFEKDDLTKRIDGRRKPAESSESVRMPRRKRAGCPSKVQAAVGKGETATSLRDEGHLESLPDGKIGGKEAGETLADDEEVGHDPGAAPASTSNRSW